MEKRGPGSNSTGASGFLGRARYTSNKQSSLRRGQTLRKCKARMARPKVSEGGSHLAARMGLVSDASATLQPADHGWQLADWLHPPGPLCYRPEESSSTAKHAKDAKGTRGTKRKNQTVSIPLDSSSLH
jgi:hypothetical protein